MTRRTLLVLALAGGIAAAHPPTSEEIARVTERLAAGPDAALLLERAELQRVAGHWDDARRDATEALALDPSLHEARICLARTALDRGDAASAVTLAERAIAAAEDVRAWRVMARAETALGDHAAAAAAWAHVLDVADPLTPDDVLEAAWLHARHEPAERAAALAVLDLGMARLGPLVALRAEAVAVARDAGMLDEALARVDALVTDRPGSPEWNAERGRLLAVMHREPEAWAAWSDALAALRAMPAHHRDTPERRALEAELTSRLEVGAMEGTR